MKPDSKTIKKTTSRLSNIVLLFIVCSTLFVGKCFGQSITWQRTYDGPLHEDDIGYDICKADGDNFYIVGYANYHPNVILTIKINKYGDILWTRTVSDPNGLSIRALAVVSSGDGGCVLTGDWDSSFTIKYDKFGNLVWQKFYGGFNVQCYDILRTTDGGYLVCGRAYLDGYILKIDSNGTYLWDRTFSFMGIRTYNSIVKSIDQGLIIAGGFSVTPNVPGDALFTNIDFFGNILNENKFKFRGASTGLTTICKTDSCYIAAGNYYSGQEQRVFISKLGLKGEIIDTSSFYSMRNEYEPRVISINANRMVFTSVKDTAYPIPSFVLIRILDSSFNIINQKSFRWTEDLTVKSIYPESNGDILFAGWSKDPAPIRANVYALRTDSVLNAIPPIGILSFNNYKPNHFMFESFPNPFNPVTNIKFSIPYAGQSYTFDVLIKIYDVTGREVFSYSDTKQPGTYEIQFDGTNLASGLYFYSLEVGNTGSGRLFKDTKKMVLLK